MSTVQAPGQASGGLDALEVAYQAAGLFLALVAAGSWFDRAGNHRLGRTVFWGLYALSFLAGSWISATANGVLVVGLVMASCLLPSRPGRLPAPGARALRSVPWRLLLPIFMLPTLTAAGVVVIHILARHGLPLTRHQATPVALVAAALLSLLAAMALLRAPLGVAIHQGRRLLDAIGPVAVLPQLLASFGAVLAQAGLGQTIAATLAGTWPQPEPWLAVLLYAGGMVLLTVVLGNAFAAFPVMTVGVALPMLVQQHHADAAATAAVGMLCGYCGTLLSPLAANFNLVPVGLLGLDDRLAVIKAQAPTAIMLLLVNLLLLMVIIPHD